MRSVVALASLLLTVSAKAGELPNQPYIPLKYPAAVQAFLTNVNADPKLNLGDVAYATISVEVPKGQAKLLIYNDTCPKGVMCIVGIMVKQVIELPLPIVSAQTDACGSYVVEAQADERPVDGLLRKLTIYDNTQNTCPTLVAMESTNVAYETSVYDRIPGQEVTTRSTFSGTALRPLK